MKPQLLRARFRSWESGIGIVISPLLKSPLRVGGLLHCGRGDCSKTQPYVRYVPSDAPGTGHGRRMDAVFSGSKWKKPGPRRHTVYNSSTVYSAGPAKLRWGGMSQPRPLSWPPLVTGRAAALLRRSPHSIEGGQPVVLCGTRTTVKASGSA